METKEKQALTHSLITEQQLFGIKKHTDKVECVQTFGKYELYFQSFLNRFDLHIYTDWLVFKDGKYVAIFKDFKEALDFIEQEQKNSK